MKAENVLKIVDIDYRQLKEKTLVYLKKYTTPSYTDMLMNEHIYHIEDIFDNYREEQGADEEILSDMECMIGLVQQNEAGYIRITFN
jgi:hypothetical protein